MLFVNQSDIRYGKILKLIPFQLLMSEIYYHLCLFVENFDTYYGTSVRHTSRFFIIEFVDKKKQMNCKKKSEIL